MGQFLEVARFECRYHLNSLLFPFLAVVFFLIHYFAGMRMGISIGTDIYAESLNLNAAIVIIQNEVILSGFAMFPVIALVATAITRDHDRKTAEMFYAAPVSEGDHFFGRFAAGLLFAALVATAGLLGNMTGLAMPWLDQAQINDFLAGPYLYSLFIIVLPNMFVFSTLAYASAALTRSIASAFSVAMIFMALSIGLAAIVGRQSPEWASLIGPFGYEAIATETRYWTGAELNSNLPGGIVLLNRMIWLGIGTVVLLFTWWRFRFRLDAMSLRFWPVLKDHAQPPTATGTHTFKPQFSIAGTVLQFLSQLRMDFRGIALAMPFYVVLIAAISTLVGVFMSATSLVLDQPLYPVTATMIDNIRQSLPDFLTFSIIYFSAELVHRARQAQVAEMADAAPWANILAVLSKVSALWLMVICTLLALLVTSLILQALSGYTNFEPGLYITALFGFDAAHYFFLCVAGVTIQIFSPNKWVGMAIFIALFLTVASFQQMGIEHLLYGFSIPSTPWSDMNGWGHFVGINASLTAYWAAFWIVMLMVGALAIQRGLYDGASEWMADAKSRITRSAAAMASFIALCFLTLGTWIFYNTNVLNEYTTLDDALQAQVEYETSYKRYNDQIIPDLVSIDAEVDVFPAERRIESRGTARLVNQQAIAIEEILFTMNSDLTINQIDLEGATLIEENSSLGVYRYRFDAALLAGESASLEWNFSWINQGFPNSRPNNDVVENGTYVVYYRLMPVPGYRESREVENSYERRNLGLPPKDPLAPLGDEVARNKTYYGNAPLSYRNVISTAADQIAVTQGILKRDWTEQGRRYFEYESEIPIAPGLTVHSARYEVARDSWNDVELEIFHDPKHAFNARKMLETSQQGLQYYSDQFSPYQFSQFRIVEFPRYITQARGMPGTVPYSEGVGFITDFRELNSVDYGTAHELAHMWWGNQARGPRFMQGTQMLNEGLASYSALMLIQEINGADHVHSLLQMGVDAYLRMRGTVGKPEVPLMYTNEGYISYNKGASVMFALQDIIGESKVHTALRSYLEKYAFKPIPFPTAQDLVNELRAVAGDEYQDLITDLFEKITFYDLSVTAVTSRKVDNGFEITMDILARQMQADGAGVEVEAPLKTWLDIAVFADDDIFGGTAPLYFKRHLITSGAHRIVIEVPREAVSVGIDPYGKMIDRNSGDNLLAF